MTRTTGWIGVDFDRTLAKYDSWNGETHTGEPIAIMVDRVKTWLASGHEVRIFTARVEHPIRPGVVPALEAWMLEHLGQVLPMTNVKDRHMWVLWDDRCVQMVPNTGIPIGGYNIPEIIPE